MATSAAIDVPSCTEVTSEVVSCVSYVRNGGSPSSTCCEGVAAVAKMAKTKEDRVAICNCLKSALGHIGSYDPSRLPPLSKSCGVNVDLPPVDQSYDCSK